MIDKIYIQSKWANKILDGEIDFLMLALIFSGFSFRGLSSVR